MKSSNQNGYVSGLHKMIQKDKNYFQKETLYPINAFYYTQNYGEDGHGEDGHGEDDHGKNSTYWVLKPKTRVEFQEETCSRILVLVHKKEIRCMVVTAPPASGKSKLIAMIVDKILSEMKDSVFYIVTSSDILEKQMRMEFSEFLIKTMKKTMDEAKEFMKHVRFYHGLGHIRKGDDRKGKEDEFISTTQTMLDQMKNDNENGLPITVLVDEFAQSFTSMVGGMKPRIDTSKDTKAMINTLFEQEKKGKNLNIYDQFRKYAKVILFSGTSASTLINKIPLMGYQWDQISVLNISPIPGLLNINVQERHISKFNVDDIAEIKSGEHFKKEDQPYLIVCTSRKEIEKIKRDYKRKYGDMNCCEILAGTKLDLKKLKTAQYVFAINKACFGFDLFRMIGKNFKSIFVQKKFSDSVSNPLSKNVSGEYYFDKSENLLQLLGRARPDNFPKTVYIYVNNPKPDPYPLEKLYYISQFERMRKWNNETKIIRQISDNNVDRMLQARFLGICRTTRENDLTIIRTFFLEMMDYMKETGRDMKMEIKNKTADPDDWVRIMRAYYVSKREKNPVPVKIVQKEKGSSGNNTNPSLESKKLCSKRPLKSNSKPREIKETEKEREMIEKKEKKERERTEKKERERTEKKEKKERERTEIKEEKTKKKEIKEREKTEKKEKKERERIEKKEKKEREKTEKKEMERGKETEHISIETVSNSSFKDSEATELENISEITNSTETRKYGNTKKGRSTTSGGSTNKLRKRIPKIMKEIEERANGKCAFCGFLFMEVDDVQDSHIKRHDKEGEYTLDNIVRTHADCDSGYDHGGFFQDPETNERWYLPRFANRKMDNNQLKGISYSNIRHRWDWNKERLKCKEMSDTEFRKRLLDNYQKETI